MLTKNHLRKINNCKCLIHMLHAGKSFIALCKNKSEILEAQKRFREFSKTILDYDIPIAKEMHEIMLLHDHMLSAFVKDTVFAVGDQHTTTTINMVSADEFADKLYRRLIGVDLHALCELVFNVLIVKDYSTSYVFDYIMISILQCVVEMQTTGSITGYDFITNTIFVDDQHVTKYDVLLVFSEFDVCNDFFLQIYFEHKYGKGYLEKLKDLKKSASKEKFKRIYDRVVYCDISFVLPLLVNPNGGVCDIFSCVTKKTISTKEDISSQKVYDFIHTLLNIPDIFLHRRRIMKSGGVLLRLKHPIHGIVSILCRESHDAIKDLHFLFLEVTCEDGSRRPLFLNLKDPSSVLSILLYEIDYYALALFSAWICRSEFPHFFNDNIDDLIVVEDPKSWNNVKKIYGKKNLQLHRNYNDFEEQVIHVGAYIRRLPNGFHASPEKIEAAKNYYLDLKEGYTLVEGFERKQKIRRISV